MSELTAWHAAVIGINGYSNGISGLRSALTDAREVARVLEKSHRYDRPHLLLDEQATLDGMTRLLEADLPATVRKESALVVYFAGHGVARGDGEEGPRGFLLPFDAHPAREETWLSMERAHEAWSSSSAAISWSCSIVASPAPSAGPRAAAWCPWDVRSTRASTSGSYAAKPDRS